MGATVIQPFAESQQEEVVALWERCGLLRPWNDPRKDIARKLRVQRELFLVALAGGAVVGTAMAGYDGHRGWVYYLAVDPGWQRRGLGRRLMAEVERQLRELGCPKINLMVRSDNVGVVAFYQALGYFQDAAVSLGKRLEQD
jgi:ribosomal protein S18 acetylase RimI-like enzyme